MKVLYDITTLANIHCAKGVNPAGIFWSVQELGLALSQRQDVDFYLSTAASQASKAIRYLRDTGNFSVEQFPLSMGDEGGSLAQELVLSERAGKWQDAQNYFLRDYSPANIYGSGEMDVFHVNWRGETSLPENSSTPVIATVYDLICLKTPEYFVQPGEENPIADYLEAYINSVKPEHSLVAISQAVKDDLLEIFPHLNSRQIYVLPLGVADRFAPCSDESRLAAAKSAYEIPEGQKYVLCVNTIEPRKNTVSVIKAYRKLLSGVGLADINLVLVGSDGWLSDDIHQLLDSDAEEASGGVYMTGFVDADDLPLIYAGAELFCYPSFDEGFGLPILEAMKSGVPVITSDRAVFREVAGDAAVFVEPTDVDALSEAMAKVLQDSKLAANLREAGRHRASEYSWKRSAEVMVDIYRDVCERFPLEKRAELDMRHFRSNYQDKRLFICAGSGNLRATGTRLLAEEYTLGIGSFYRDLESVGFKPSFYAVSEAAQSDQDFEFINALTAVPIFTDCPSMSKLREGPGVYLWNAEGATRRYAGATGSVESGEEASALVSAIELASMMGFSSYFLVGVDDEVAESARTLLDGRARDNTREYSGGGVRGSQQLVPANGYDNRLFVLSHEESSENAKATVKRVSPEKLLSEDCVKEYARDQRAHLDETEVVSAMVEQMPNLAGTMIDVGAHRGHAAKHFVDKGWQILCYEPDDDNRKHLVTRFGHRENVSIDKRAVLESAQHQLDFYKSEESSGISGLLKFRDTHEVAASVDSTSVAEIVADHRLDRVGFLKIDVEGFDFSVLKGVPWADIQPDIIEVEYDDYKTLALGHTWRDIGAYLCDRGYSVYISEWHPIIRYGIPHDWKRVVPWPGTDVATDSWGNILAFKQDPGYEAVANAFKQLVAFRPPTAGTEPAAQQLGVAGKAEAKGAAASRVASASVRATEHRHIREKLVRAIPGVARIGRRLLQATRMFLRFCRRYRLASLGATSAILALVLLPYHYFPSHDVRFLFWGVALLMLMAFGFVSIGFELYMIFTAKQEERLRQLEANLASKVQLQDVIDDLKKHKRVSATVQDVANLQSRLERGDSAFGSKSGLQESPDTTERDLP